MNSNVYETKHTFINTNAKHTMYVVQILNRLFLHIFNIPVFLLLETIFFFLAYKGSMRLLSFVIMFNCPIFSQNGNICKTVTFFQDGWYNNQHV